MEETIMTGESFYVTETKNFKRDDIVVFDYLGEDHNKPSEETGKFELSWQKWIKRLIALSGDSLEIKDGEIFINGKFVPSAPGSITEYDVLSVADLSDFPPREEWQQAVLQEMKGDTFHYVVHLTAKQAAGYRQRRPAVVSVKKRLANYEPLDTFLLKPCPDCQWTVDNFGPLIIPSPGDTVTVTPLNFRLYHNIPGIHPGKNTIKEKLYFVMGDNRHGSQDSRFIGYISHSKMYGVVK